MVIFKVTKKRVKTRICYEKDDFPPTQNSIVVVNLKGYRNNLTNLECCMTPLPKRKTSSGRRDRRRSHDALLARNSVNCPNCGEALLPHRVCTNCGHYQGREVLSVEKDKTKK